MSQDIESGKIDMGAPTLGEIQAGASNETKAENIWDQHHYDCPWYRGDTASCAVGIFCLLRDCDHRTCPFVYWLATVK